ncbi:prostaglandin D2 receptor-like [Protopterus annectens]|uniref:prostaglandin D2 receptor-like n=1 Tax=Protopterus annectens TaxID=7888 RepID=UPI001CF951B4|nr:prostaglandin D2 receptor-like [Protopterus annectens]
MSSDSETLHYLSMSNSSCKDDTNIGCMNHSCIDEKNIGRNASVITSAVLFGTGVFGNVIALIILLKHKRTFKHKISVFYVLASGLVLNDLLGKCLVSAPVFVCYALNKTLKGIADGNNSMCNSFAFLMAFFALTSIFILLAMALECCLSLGYPYFYQRHITKRKGLLCFTAVYLFCLIFSSLPLLGFGQNVQYCPGTWCFIQMTSDSSKNVFSYAVLYATLMGVLIFAVMVCNILAMKNLIKMQKTAKRTMRSNSLYSSEDIKPGGQNTEESGHLILLVIMTVSFMVCSLPFMVRAYTATFAPDKDEAADLIAIRFLSVHSIIDPWLFIIFRTSVFRTTCRKVYDKLWPG